MEKNSEHEPESTASLLGMEASPSSEDSPIEDRFSALRIAGLCLAIFVQLFFLWIHGFSLNSITFDSIITVFFANIAIPLVLIIRFKKTFLSFVSRLPVACFKKPFPTIEYVSVSQWLGSLSLGIGTFALVVGIGFIFFFYPDVEKLNSFGLPAFWLACIMLLFYNYALFLRYSFSPLESESMEDESGQTSVPLIRRIFGFTRLCFGFIFITLVLFYGFTLLGSYVFGLLSDSPYYTFFSAWYYHVFFWAPSLLLATYQKSFTSYVPEAIAAFFSKRKPNLRFVEISRVGGKIAFGGAILSIAFVPLSVLPRLTGDKDWESDPTTLGSDEIWPEEVFVWKRLQSSTLQDFSQRFEVPEQVRSARLRVKSKNASFKIEMNGQLVCEADDGRLVEREVVSFLQKGDNLISLKALALGNKSVMANPRVSLKLEWIDQKGNRATLITDENWKATLGDNEDTTAIYSFPYWSDYERLLSMLKESCLLLYMGLLFLSLFSYLQYAFSEKK